MDSVVFACQNYPTPSLSLSGRSQARAAIGYSYGGEDGETDQARRDEQLLAEYLGEDEGDEEKAFSSESEYGKSNSEKQFFIH